MIRWTLEQAPAGVLENRRRYHSPGSPLSAARRRTLQRSATVGNLKRRGFSRSYPKVSGVQGAAMSSGRVRGRRHHMRNCVNALRQHGVSRSTWAFLVLRHNLWVSVRFTAQFRVSGQGQMLQMCFRARNLQCSTLQSQCVVFAASSASRGGQE